MTEKPFSERMGYTAPKPVQIDDLDKDARTALYNLFRLIEEDITAHDRYVPQKLENFWKAAGMGFFNMKVEKILSCNAFGAMRASPVMEGAVTFLFDSEQWFKIFDWFEFVYRYICNRANGYARYKKTQTSIPYVLNDIMEKQNIGYKFIDGKFISIQTKEEQDAIEDALKIPYTAAREHVKKAVALFSKRPAPDYANSIKESISAAESVCKELTGEKDFAAAARKMKIPMHPAFRESMVKLYGFASDEEGVRHAATGEPLQVNQATARYVLITCAAFVNYIAAQTSD